MTPRAAINLIIGCTLVLSVATAGDGTLPGDVAVQRFVQEAPQPPARWVADFGNWIGSSRVFAVIAAVLALALFTARKPWDAGFMLAALALRTLNGPLKNLLDSPRPTTNVVRVTEIANGLGFPSGHAMGSMLGYGAIALIAHGAVPARRVRRSIEALCAATIVTVGFGRIYVGAHWPSDVLGGYLWGGLILWLAHWGWTTLRRRRE